MSSPLIRDIPSIAKTLKNAKDMAAFKRIMPFCRPFLKLLRADVAKLDDASSQVDELVRRIEEMSKIPDRFNEIFSSRGWIIYNLLNLEVAKAAIVKAEASDINGAESDLVDYYSPETLRWKLQAMHGV